jgi:phage baseplate assembly protein W
MAIIDKSQNKWYTNDRDENVSIGFRLPLILDNGELASTKTTIEAVKQNILNLCSTELGERVMQPGLGIMLKKFLFEPFTEDIVSQVQNTIVESMNYWLPFVLLRDIKVRMSEVTAGNLNNTMEVSVIFSLRKDPNTHESVQIIVGE